MKNFLKVKSKPGCCAARLPPRSPGARIKGFFGWIGPGAVLVMMPKCPMCFAAAIALATGMGISVAAATILRSSLIALSVIALCAVAVRSVWIVVQRFGLRCGKSGAP